MFKNISLRMKLTIINITLLTVCCVGLTIILNFSAYKMANVIDASILTPSNEATPNEQVQPETFLYNKNFNNSIPSQSAESAKIAFKFQSIMYMLLIIIAGGFLTNYISKKVLYPLDLLNKKIKSRNVNNLSEEIKIPNTKDEIAELTESFNEMTNKLNSAFMMQRNFSANAAHELRTPLTVLQTKIDVFKMKKSHTLDEYDSLITVIERHTKRLSELVKNLLNITNLTEDMTSKPINLKIILQDIINELSYIAEQRNIKLSLNCSDTIYFGSMDLLYRAFYNIIENGIKYNVDNGEVIINVHSDNNNVIIEISDTGIGIPEDMKESIFEPFYRVDKSRSRKIGGAGLGLSIVDSIIKKYNGEITINNNGNGSTFKVVLKNNNS
ncbi:MAG: HAMP domain-containing sensor histidine kinase [Clostridium sp.]|uniref:sensor histidine kinase n=1 Tax=Clostridium sp. TaxID=1506 RepID=UPI00290734EC|nr:HAMP domain-containing sensor histidine kinase [Clostridium sp.]MDU4939326.1 HAMP domain-containing sensor histidine kinase [Clostridium sp.]